MKKYYLIIALVACGVCLAAVLPEHSVYGMLALALLLGFPLWRRADDTRKRTMDARRASIGEVD
jgi:hypothetical protein